MQQNTSEIRAKMLFVALAWGRSVQVTLTLPQGAAVGSTNTHFCVFRLTTDLLCSLKQNFILVSIFQNWIQTEFSFYSVSFYYLLFVQRTEAN